MHTVCFKLCTSTFYTLTVVTLVNRAHLGDVFQELWAGKAVLCGATVCFVVEKTEECGVQLKQPTIDKYQRFL